MIVTISMGQAFRYDHAVIVVWDNERAGYYRAFWAAAPDATVGCPVIGYASAGGSHRTVRAAAAEARRFHPGVPVYRGGRIVQV